MQVSFRVMYHVSSGSYYRDAVIACCFMALFTVLFTIYRLINWQVRAIRPTIDVVVLGKFVLIFAGLFGNVLFIILYATTVCWSLIYKASFHVLTSHMATINVLCLKKLHLLIIAEYQIRPILLDDRGT